jgi:calpain-7
MRQHLSRIPVTNSKKNRAVYELLQAKISHYEKLASTLLNQPSPSNDKGTSILFNPINHTSGANKCLSRSPISNKGGGGGRDFINSSTLKVEEQRDPKNSLRDCKAKTSQTVLNDSTDLKHLNQKANLLLSQALDEDELYMNIKSSSTGSIKQNQKGPVPSPTNLVSKYMQAAEIYLQAIQIIKTKSNDIRDCDHIEATMKQRLQQTLDRIEQLKEMAIQTSHTVKDGMKPSVKNQHPEGSATLRAHTLLSPSEIQVLKESSLMTSGLFLPWSDIEANNFSAECNKNQKQVHSATVPEMYTDPAGFLQLSKEQTERFHAWARPTEILRMRKQHNNILSSLKILRLSNANATAEKHDVDKNVIMMPPSSTITPYTIQQKCVTDCSFIASLCVCANYERRFHKPLISSILYPQSLEAKYPTPIYNPKGKYIVKLWLNGIPRCVEIDDYLPIDKNGNLLCSQTVACTTSNDKLELWVCLIEKAYMKLCGGYNFPGSNSGIDLFSLTGWIPEQIYFASTKNDAISTVRMKDHETPSERVWDRIYSASSFGDCLITVATLSQGSNNAEASEVGLVSAHAYAVLSVVQTTGGIRLLQLKNPWAHQSFKGRYSCHDKDSWSCHKLRNEIGFDPAEAKKADDGVFWICWEDILYYFQDFHLSWNPNLFTSRYALHGQWLQSQGPTDDSFNIGDNPQYSVKLSDAAVQKKATLWILISRHVNKQEQAGAEVKLPYHFECLTWYCKPLSYSSLSALLLCRT